MDSGWIVKVASLSVYNLLSYYHLCEILLSIKLQHVAGNTEIFHTILNEKQK